MVVIIPFEPKADVDTQLLTEDPEGQLVRIQLIEAMRRIVELSSVEDAHRWLRYIAFEKGETMPCEDPEK